MHGHVFLVFQVLQCTAEKGTTYFARIPLSVLRQCVPHTAALTQLEIGQLDFETISHSPYSPDLVPFDFTVFPSIKSKCHGFRSLQELQIATAKIISFYAQELYKDVYKRWIHPHKRCVEVNREYFDRNEL